MRVLGMIGRLSPFQCAIKRFFDVATSLVALTAFAPVYLLVAILIKATSEGPVFYRHVKLGLNGRRFTVFVFRSVYISESLSMGASQTVGPVRVVGPRVSPVGRFLRRTSFDMLPLYFNVLIGDMSLIGPRAVSADKSDSINERRRVLKVRPGMTGLWQVSGQNSFEEMARLDSDYEQRFNLWLDLEILVRTLYVVLASMKDKTAVRVSSPPGTLAGKVAQFLVSKKTMEYKINPAISDLQCEYFAALQEGHRFKSYWVIIRGHVSILRMFSGFIDFIFEMLKAWWSFR